MGRYSRGALSGLKRLNFIYNILTRLRLVTTRLQNLLKDYVQTIKYVFSYVISCF